MSHDSGFRRNDHDATHGPTMRRQRRSKASQAFEDRMKRRHADQERLRKLLEESKDPANQPAAD